MFAAIPDFGLIYIMLLMSCLVPAIVLKLTSKIVRKLGEVDIVTESLWLLWLYCIGGLLVGSFLGLLAGLFVHKAFGWTVVGLSYFISLWASAHWLLYPSQIRRKQTLKSVVLAAVQASLALISTVSLTAMCWYM